MVSIDLNPIEMALVAELNLEMARTYDEVADDETRSPEDRRIARETASRWHERARMWQRKARSARGQAIVPDGRPTFDHARSYAGLERRAEERRGGDRRRGALAGADRLARAGAGGDRRATPDRRQRERRR